MIQVQSYEKFEIFHFENLQLKLFDKKTLNEKHGNTIAQNNLGFSCEPHLNLAI
jgi:hypothetical protein